MGVPGQLRRHGTIAGREFQTAAIRKLSDVSAIEFLPWRVVFKFGRSVDSAAGRQGFLGHQNVDPPAAEVDSEPVAGLQDSEIAADCAFGAGVQDRGTAEVPDCRPSPMVGSSWIPARMSSAGGCMFTTSADPG